MKRFMKIASFAAIASAVLLGTAGAEMMGMGKGMGGQMKGMGSQEMQKKMEEIHHHSKMMEGMKDQKQLMGEMRKHMKMTDEMMELMATEGAGASDPAGGGGSMQHGDKPMPSETPGMQGGKGDQHMKDMHQKMDQMQPSAPPQSGGGMGTGMGDM